MIALLIVIGMILWNCDAPDLLSYYCAAYLKVFRVPRTSQFLQTKMSNIKVMQQEFRQWIKMCLAR